MCFKNSRLRLNNSPIVLYLSSWRWLLGFPAESWEEDRWAFVSPIGTMQKKKNHIEMLNYRVQEMVTLNTFSSYLNYLWWWPHLELCKASFCGDTTVTQLLHRLPLPGWSATWQVWRTRLLWFYYICPFGWLLQTCGGAVSSGRLVEGGGGYWEKVDFFVCYLSSCTWRKKSKSHIIMSRKKVEYKVDPLD